MAMFTLFDLFASFNCRADGFPIDWFNISDDEIELHWTDDDLQEYNYFIQAGTFPNLDAGRIKLLAREENDCYENARYVSLYFFSEVPATLERI